MKNKQIIASLCVGLIGCVSIVSGCSLVTTNYDKYYNAVAARISYKDEAPIEITRKQLRDTYSRYGFEQNAANYPSQEKAYEAALDYLVAKKLAIRDAERISRLQSDDKTNADDILTIKEKNYLFEKVYEGLERNLNSYIKTTDSGSSSSTTTGSIKMNEYERKVDLVYDEDSDSYKILTVNNAVSELEKFVPTEDVDRDATIDEDKEILFTRFDELKREDPAHMDAYNNYLSDLRQSEKVFKLSTDAKSVFLREIDRIYTILYDELMVDKYEAYYIKDNQQIYMSKLLDLYSSDARVDYTKYEKTNPDAFTSDVIENIGDVSYFKEDITWIFVSHILLKFDTTEAADLKTLKEQQEKGGTDKELAIINGKIEALYENLSAQVRTKQKDGSWVVDDNAEKLDAYAILDIVKDKVKVSGEINKAKAFNELIFQYNEDDGIINSDFNYVVGYQPGKPDEEEGTSYSAYSNWVPAFEKAAIELYNNGNGQFGDIYFEPIRSDYGIHIMMYAGTFEPLFTVNGTDFVLSEGDASSSNVDERYANILKLRNTRLNPAIDKTYFDKLCESLIPKNASTIFQELDQDRLEDETERIEYFPQAY